MIQIPVKNVLKITHWIPQNNVITQVAEVVVVVYYPLQTSVIRQAVMSPVNAYIHLED